MLNVIDGLIKHPLYTLKLTSEMLPRQWDRDIDAFERWCLATPNPYAFAKALRRVPDGDDWLLVWTRVGAKIGAGFSGGPVAGGTFVLSERTLPVLDAFDVWQEKRYLLQHEAERRSRTPAIR